MVDRAPPSRVTVEWHDFVALLTINRPERHNAVDLPILRAIREAQSDVLDKGGRAMVITGTPPAFCSGADLSGAHEEEFASALDEVVHGMTTMPIVTVACINGPALGAGAQIALSCDIRVASADSVIGVPAAKLGLVVSHWTIERLVRELSWPVARAMLLTARLYTGAELNQLGSVHRIGDVNDALLWAQEIAALAPLSIAGHKLALAASGADPLVNDLVAEARERAWRSNDAIEGRRAFLAKRPPNFMGS